VCRLVPISCSVSHSQWQKSQSQSSKSHFPVKNKKKTKTKKKKKKNQQKNQQKTTTTTNKQKKQTCKSQSHFTPSGHGAMFCVRLVARFLKPVSNPYDCLTSKFARDKSGFTNTESFKQFSNFHLFCIVLRKKKHINKNI